MDAGPAGPPGGLVDRSTARTLCSLKCEDPDVTKFTAAQYNTELALAEKEFALETLCIEREATLTSVANQAYIDVSGIDDLILFKLIRHKGLKLRPVSKFGLTYQNADDWTDDTGTPLGSLYDGENDRLYLVPIPQTEDAGANVLALYAALPATISSDATELLSAREKLQVYAPGIVALAAYRMLGYLTQTPELQVKRSQLMGEYGYYKDRAIQLYNNIVDAPIRMAGGRNWQDRNMAGRSNAFSD